MKSWPWEDKFPVVDTSLLSLPLQQPKLNPASADRAQFSLSLTTNFSCCFCFQLWHFLAPARTQCRKLTLLKNQKRNQCWCNKLRLHGVRQEGINGKTTVTLAKVGWMALPVSPSLKWEWVFAVQGVKGTVVGVCALLMLYWGLTSCQAGNA